MAYSGWITALCTVLEYLWELWICTCDFKDPIVCTAIPYSACACCSDATVSEKKWGRSIHAYSFHTSITKPWIMRIVKPNELPERGECKPAYSEISTCFRTIRFFLLSQPNLDENNAFKYGRYDLVFTSIWIWSPNFLLKLVRIDSHQRKKQRESFETLRENCRLHPYKQ